MAPVPRVPLQRMLSSPGTVTSRALAPAAAHSPGENSTEDAAPSTLIYRHLVLNTFHSPPKLRGEILHSRSEPTDVRQFLFLSFCNP